MEEQAVNCDRAIKLAADTIINGTRRLNQEILSELRSDAPETTPDSIEVRFGQAQHQKGDSNYRDFMIGVIYGYISQEHRVSAPEARRRAESAVMIDELSEFESADGKSIPGQDYIWSATLPRDLIPELQQIIADKIGGLKLPREIKMFLANFPSFYSRITDMSRVKYRGNLAHEMTHLWLKQNTKLKGLAHQAQKTEVSGDAFAASLFGGGTTKRQQAINIAGRPNERLEAIDEAVAFFISDHYGLHVNPTPSLFSNYGDPEAISWAIKILQQKTQEVNGSKVDYVRKLELQIFEELAQRGQVTNSGERRDPMAVFLRHCLPETEKNRLNKFREIVEEDLSAAYRDLKSATKDMDQYEQSSGNQRILSKVREFENEVDWDNPAHIEDRVLHRTINEAVGSLTLDEVHSRVNQILEEEIGYLDKIVEFLKQLDHEIGLADLDAEIRRSAREIIAVEEELAQLQN